MAKASKLSLRNVRNLNDVCSLYRDHFEWRDWSIMTDGRVVWISKQKMGHERTDHIEIPKKIFDVLFDRYGKPMPRGKWDGDKLHPHR